MPSVKYTISFSSGTNSDKPSGSTLSGRIVRDTAAAPAGSSVTSASVYISSLKCYTGNSPYLVLGSYGYTGTLTKNNNVHSDTVSGQINNSILDVSNESITITVRSSSNGNVVNIRTGCEIEITVNYKLGITGSTATFSPTTVDAGSKVTATLSNTNLTSVSHKITYKIGDYTETVTVSKGTATSEFTVPLEWLNAIPSSLQGTISVKVETQNGNTTAGTNSYTIAMSVPDSVVPTIGSVVLGRTNNDVPSDWGIYVQNQSGALILASTCDGVYGSTITTYNFSDGANQNVQQSNYYYDVETITRSGTITYTVTITDSRGRTASASSSIYVYPYENPSFSSSVAYRCNQSGESSETGTYIAARTNCSVSSCNNKNTSTLSVQYQKTGTSSWYSGATISSGTTVIIGSGTVDANYNYRVKFIQSDQFTTIEKIINVSTAMYTMFFRKGGTGIAFGQACNRECAIEINGSWELYHGDVNLIEKINSLEKRIKALGG